MIVLGENDYVNIALQTDSSANIKLFRTKCTCIKKTVYFESIDSPQRQFTRSYLADYSFYCTTIKQFIYIFILSFCFSKNKDELPALTPLGCYKDTYGDRAMPVLYKNFRDEINWNSMSKTVSQCARVAYHSGYKYFGVQFYGECWSGVTANETYDQYGEATNCWEGVGEEWSNFVYKLN